MEEIYLTKNTILKEKWFVQSTKRSYIFYLHELTGYNILQSIRVDNLLNHGFPQTNMIDSEFLVSLAHKHDVKIK